MKIFFDLFPLLLFFIAFKFYDIYVATAVAIAASFLQVGVFWLMHRRFETMHLITLAIIVVFGGLTLILHDEIFIKWKPTILYWVLAVVILASHFVGRETVIQKLLGAQITLPPGLWHRYNLSWGILFVVLGALNLYVAFYYALDQDAETRRNIWVNFKVFGLMAITFVFVIIQAIYLARHIKPDETSEGER